MRTGRSWLLVVAFLAVPSVAAGGELRLLLGNDYMGRNPSPDDLYTSDFEVRYQASDFGIGLRENTFTDRQAGLRFDETYVVGSRGWRPSGWDVEVSGGALHVGQGLLGESGQNALHRVVGESQVHLGYVESSQWHGHVGVRAARSLLDNGRWRLLPMLEAHSAFGFKAFAAISFRAEATLSRYLRLATEVGNRWTRSDYLPLDPWIRPTAPVWEIGLAYRRFYAAYDYNRFGTGNRHFQLEYRIPVGSASPVQRHGG